MVSDYISDLVARIKNGYNAKLPSILVKNSRTSREILHILQKLGFISSFQVVSHVHVRIFLIYYRNDPGVRYIRRISKPSNRIYISKASLSKSVSFGNKTNKFFIVSTNRGLLTDIEAMLLGVGGELLLEIC